MNPATSFRVMQYAQPYGALTSRLDVKLGVHQMFVTLESQGSRNRVGEPITEMSDLVVPEGLTGLATVVNGHELVDALRSLAGRLEKLL